MSGLPVSRLGANQKARSPGCTSGAPFAYIDQNFTVAIKIAFGTFNTGRNVSPATIFFVTAVSDMSDEVSFDDIAIAIV